MNIDLDKNDLIAMVKGSSPNYHVMERLSKYGDYSGSMMFGVGIILV